MMVASKFLAALMMLTPALVSASKKKSSSKFDTVLPVDLPTMEDLRVTDLDKVVPVYGSFEGQMFSGQLPIDHQGVTTRTGNLQFWLFVPDAPSAPNTTVAWFNGGPGCSSMFGNVFEMGPIMVPHHEAGFCCEGTSEPLEANEFAWTKATTVLYVEQPVGVGFSEATNGTPPPESEDDVAADFEAFLQNFYKVFESLAPHKLYLVGESYAGIYIPSIARGIHLRNEEKKQPEGRIPIALSGIAIGNGKIDDMSQDLTTVDFMYWHGLIDGPTKNFLHDQWQHCTKYIEKGEGEIGFIKKKKGKKESYDKGFHHFSIRDDCGLFAAAMNAAGSGAMEPTFEGGMSIYEYSTWDPYAAGEGDTGTIGSFFNNLEVQKALNVPDHLLGMHWLGCVPENEEADDRRKLHRAFNADVAKDYSYDEAPRSRRHLYMDNDTPWSVTPYIAELLDDAKIDVLMYSGDRDIICNTQGTEQALRNMEWSGQKGWDGATRSLWVYNDYPAGYVKTLKNLQLLTVYNAGHMVPYNQPGPALDMLERFLKKQSYHDRTLPNYVNKGKGKETAEESALLLETSLVGDGSQADNTAVPPMSGSLLLTVGAAFLMGFVAARVGSGNAKKSFQLEGSNQDASADGGAQYGSIRPYQD